MDSSFASLILFDNFIFVKDFRTTYHFFEKELQDEILEFGVKKKFAANEIIIREGQFISSFPMVMNGLIRVSRTNDDGNELLLYYLNKNEVCAMSLTCCMNQVSSNINAVAEEQTEVILLPVEVLDTWITKYPTWKQFIMRTFQNRFRTLIETVDSIAFMKLDERLIKYFTDRNKNFGLTIYNGTHQELALQLNSSREVISRLLKKLEQKKLIKLSRNFIDFSGLV
ncbi:MAG: cyclic nucleotide-binding domain-containing protein [Draconibacterium sp.]|nr:cyclic nucleotide-binding domain-containing protein [Draconibacterium sp.]